jgi:hypothetical protein
LNKDCRHRKRQTSNCQRSPSRQILNTQKLKPSPQGKTQKEKTQPSAGFSQFIYTNNVVNKVLSIRKTFLNSNHKRAETFYEESKEEDAPGELIQSPIQEFQVEALKETNNLEEEFFLHQEEVGRPKDSPTMAKHDKGRPAAPTL